jgi:hypothetical protein
MLADLPADEEEDEEEEDDSKNDKKNEVNDKAIKTKDEQTESKKSVQVNGTSRSEQKSGRSDKRFQSKKRFNDTYLVFYL